MYDHDCSKIGKNPLGKYDKRRWESLPVPRPNKTRWPRSIWSYLISQAYAHALRLFSLGLPSRTNEIVFRSQAIGYLAPRRYLVGDFSTDGTGAGTDSLLTPGFHGADGCVDVSLAQAKLLSIIFCIRLVAFPPAPSASAFRMCGAARHSAAQHQETKHQRMHYPHASTCIQGGHDGIIQCQL